MNEHDVHVQKTVGAIAIPAGTSKPVIPNQANHPDKIRGLVKKHLAHTYKKAIRQHNYLAFEEMTQWLASRSGRPLILDSCCGTAMSSFILADKYPECDVIGIDQSSVRLDKAPSNGLPNNLRLYQGNCEDIWRLIVNADIRPIKHFILYPNPWPKARHLKRRWHGHPVFTLLPRLSETTILRSNWKAYLEEFNLAWHCLTGRRGEVCELSVENPMTLFEKKYDQSGHRLYELILGRGGMI